MVALVGGGGAAYCYFTRAPGRRATNAFDCPVPAAVRERMLSDAKMLEQMRMHCSVDLD